MCTIKKILLIATLACSFIGITACGGKSESKVDESETEQIISKSDDSTNYLIHPDSCLSISILKDDGWSVMLTEGDSHSVLNFLNSAIDDKERNTSGIKFKMTSPNCTFIIELRGHKQEMIQLWLSQSLLLFDAKWYKTPTQNEIGSIFKKY